jgi:hypothetical protein
MSRRRVASLRALLGLRRASGGQVSPRAPGADSIPLVLSPAKVITDPDEAESLGLTADARRLRRQQGAR